ncbi:MAG: tyrosine-type recombinase/integrase, partial [Chromatiales bacterium]
MQRFTDNVIAKLEPQASPYDLRDGGCRGLLVRVELSGKRTYYLQYYLDGKRRRYRIGPVEDFTVHQARRRADALRGRVARGEDIQQSRIGEREAHRAHIAAQRREKHQVLGMFLEEVYVHHVEQFRHGDMMIARIKRVFAEFLNRPMPQIGVWELTKHRQRRKRAGIAAITINRDVAELRSALSHAVELKVLDHHPLDGLKPLRADDNKIVRYLSNEEEARLRTALRARDDKLRRTRQSGNTWRRERHYEPLPEIARYADHLTPAVFVSINTGLRQGELLTLMWEDIDFARRVLTVRGTSAKSGKARHIPLNDEGLDVLAAWRKQNANKSVFPVTSIKRAWTSLRREAGIERFRWHDLRHHFASKLIMAGADLNTVRELLGHADIKMTLRYAHLAPEHKAAAVALLNAGV